MRRDTWQALRSRVVFVNAPLERSESDSSARIGVSILRKISIGTVQIFQYRYLSKYRYFWQHYFKQYLGVLVVSKTQHYLGLKRSVTIIWLFNLIKSPETELRITVGVKCWFIPWYYMVLSKNTIVWSLWLSRNIIPWLLNLMKKYSGSAMIFLRHFNDYCGNTVDIVHQPWSQCGIIMPQTRTAKLCRESCA